MKSVFSTLFLVCVCAGLALAQPLPQLLTPPMPANNAIVKQTNSKSGIRSTTAKPRFAKISWWDMMDEEWIHVIDAHMRYNASGLKMKDSSLSVFTADPPLQTLYSYTPEGWENERVNEVFNGTNWVPQMKTQIGYLTETKWTHQLYFDWTGSAWDTASKYIWTYDAQQNMTTSYHYYKTSGVWNMNGGAQFVNEYDANNRLISLTSYIDENGVLEPSWKQEYIYGIDETIIETIWSGWDGNAWEYTFRSYDITWHDFENLVLATQTGQHYTNGTWMDTTRFTTTLLPNGGKVETWQAWSGGAWVNVSRSTNEIDTHHNPVATVG